jgi:phage N-6-adenine-methyltransferase
MSSWNSEQLFSSKSTDWATPAHIFTALNDEFQFDMDASASLENNQCPCYLDKELDALSVWSWQTPIYVKDQNGNSVHPAAPRRSIFLNPPWGRSIGKWLKKAYEESRPSLGLGPTIVCLIPACTDTRWWKDYVWKAAEIRLITGRPHFIRADGHTGPSPKGACLAIYTPWSEGPPNVRMVAFETRS